MSEQKLANQPQSEKKARPKVETVEAAGPSSEMPGLENLPGRMMGSAGDALESQARTLSDKRLRTAQRQALTVQIGQLQGNDHLQRVVSRIERDRPAALSQLIHKNGKQANAALQRQAAEAPPAGAGPAGPQPAALIVDDASETLEPGQVRKSEFLGKLQTSVCATAEAAMAGTMWTVMTCPTISYWFNYYRGRDSQSIERAIRRYAPETAGATSAEAYIPPIAERVRVAVVRWAETGDITGVPEGIPVEQPADEAGPGSGLGAALAGAGGALSGVLGGAVQLQEGEASARATNPRALQSQLGAGHPLESQTRARMESAFGEDFSQVRLHPDAQAAHLSEALDARAFTVGEHVAFGAGQYQPGTPVGDALLAHELAHVLQQGSGADARPMRPGLEEDVFEQDADRAASGALVSLWSRSKTGLAGLAREAMPRLRSGLALRRCNNKKPGPVPPAVTFERYQDLFNNLWNTAPFNAMPAAASGIDPTLSSRGPRTPKSRLIFNKILIDEPPFMKAYDDNLPAGIRERMDTYQGPEGLNLIHSPRLTALQAAFTKYAAPVAAATYPAFKADVGAAAAGLDPADQLAVERSNEWQGLINQYVTDEAQRAEIRAIISPPPAPVHAPAPGPAPVGPRGTPEQRAHFLAVWDTEILYNKETRQTVWSPGATVRYVAGSQNFELGATLPDGETNPGLTLFVRTQILRGAAVIAGPSQGQFPMDQQKIRSFALPVNAPGAVPAAGDPLKFQVDILEPGAGGAMHLASTKTVEIKVKKEIVYTQAEAQAAAVEDLAYLNDNTPAGFLGKMRAKGGVPANVAAAIASGRIKLRPLTQRHDSAAFVAAAGAPDPSKVGYFVGITYANSFVGVPGAGAFSLGPGDIVANRTTDVPTNTKNDDDSLIIMVTHEAVHSADIRPAAGTDLEKYKTEFRAYWMDGRYGPPDKAICPGGAGGCSNAVYDPNFPPPGPKSPRARVIFDLLYGSSTYPYVRDDYDKDPNFRQAVDNYLIPDGINLIVSKRLEDLRALIEGWGGAGFAPFYASVRAYMGFGPAPAGGALDASEKAEINRNRAWRDLVERKVVNAVEQKMIKTDLNIP